VFDVGYFYEQRRLIGSMYTRPAQLFNEATCPYEKVAFYEKLVQMREAYVVSSNSSRSDEP